MAPWLRTLAALPGPQLDIQHLHEVATTALGGGTHMQPWYLGDTEEQEESYSTYQACLVYIVSSMPTTDSIVRLSKQTGRLTKTFGFQS